jgi:UDP-N-acetylmuramoyl-L-alanyl-D-glutamate--2,6-diaminopimelate ligase
MGEVVQELSDLVIYTMHDPRYESVIDIINDMKVEDKDNYMIIQDRKEAIDKAISIAKKNDIILIAGKGRDNYMAIEDKKVKYSDYDVLERYLKNGTMKCNRK